jgi:hypothetical protein
MMGERIQPSSAGSTPVAAVAYAILADEWRQLR